MNLSPTKIKILIACLIVAFFAISLTFRVALPYDSVFSGSWIKFTSNDAYFHMRLVDNLVHNFPHLTRFDPYFIFPGGVNITGVHFFDYLLATVIWVIGLGSPTQHLVDVIGAYFPAVLAALTIIPVFFIAKTLFNRWVGLMAAFLMAILPGEFLGRSILGFTDNHVAEALFSTTFACFLILALQPGAASPQGKGPLTLDSLLKRDWQAIRRPLLFSLLAGIFLGLYLITWMGALLFVFITSLYLIIQFIINQFRRKPSDHLGIIGFVVFLVAFIIFVPMSPGRSFTLVMVAAVLIPPVLAALSRLMLNRPALLYPAALLVAGGALFGIFYAISPSSIGTMWSNFKYVFLPGGGASASTTMEMQPFLSPTGEFSTAVAWGNFTTNFFLLSSTAPAWLKWLFPGFALIPIAFLIWIWPKQNSAKKYRTLILPSIILALISIVVFWFVTPINWKTYFPGFGIISLLILIWFSIRQRGDKENRVLLIVWTAVILVATLVQRRFAYYLVVNIAVLSAFISWEIIWWAGLRRLSEKPAPVQPIEKRDPRRARAKKKKASNPNASLYLVNTVLVAIVVIFSVNFFNIPKSKEIAKEAPFAPSDGWQESLIWMQNNTPDPLGDPDAYYKLYTPGYQYPASAYGVTAWWDYGYWITRIAKRLPSANPSQDPTTINRVANLFLSTNQTAADSMMASLGSDYIIADYSLVASKLYAVIDWADQPADKYFDIYYVPNQGSLVPVQLPKPDFFRTLLVKLYCFDGQAVPDGKPLVLTYSDVVRSGIHIKQVSDAKPFSSYKAAQDFVSSQTSGSYDIVGANPFTSPIPLDTLTDFRLAYSSTSRQPTSGNATVPEIKIFEHLK